MARARITHDRILGPYELDRGRWVVYIAAAGGGRSPRFFQAESEARLQAKALRTLIGENPTRSVVGALNEYEGYLRDKGNKPDSVKQTRARLDRFFGDPDLDLVKLTDAQCLRYYRGFVDAGRRPDTHRNYLAEAKTFLRWCVDRGWLRNSPLEKVKGVGKRRHGKAQLRIDEARKWLGKAKELADGGDAGAVAAVMSLLMGMRASEIVTRVVRDVDDGGALLWIPTSKTEAGKRTLQIPWMLQDYLRQLTEGKGAAEFLFPSTKKVGERYRTERHTREWPRRQVKRICTLAGVPLVTAHGMRGLHSTLAVDSGVTAHVVASALGHESFATTAQSYAQGDVLEAAKQRRAIHALVGGNVSAGQSAARGTKK